MRQLLLAAALLFSLPLAAEAHPNYPGLQSHQENARVLTKDLDKKKSVSSKRVHSVKKKAPHSSHELQRIAQSPAKTERRGSYHGGNSKILKVAERYVGTKPKGMMRRAWCMQFINEIVLPKAGKKGTGSNLAKSPLKSKNFVKVRSPSPGDIAVFHRGKKNSRYGHVGVFKGWADSGKPIIVSGNGGGNKVTERAYPMKRLVAFVRPV